MHIGIPQETRVDETRVAATPEMAKKYAALGHQVTVQPGVGVAATQPDEAYVTVGARTGTTTETLGAQIMLKVRSPEATRPVQMQPGAVLVGMFNPFDDESTTHLVATNVTVFALETAPHTTRTQSMGMLSLQTNVIGYKVVMAAANHYQYLTPMLMTVVGTIKAVRALTPGVGVAGLQAIAAAKRLGAITEASDAHPAVKEQIGSLGMKPLDIPFLTGGERETTQGVDGHARPMPPDWMRRQTELVRVRVSQADIVIMTVLTPGRCVPVLLSEATVQAMESGSVVVNLAAAQGGNCPLTEVNRTVVEHGTTLVGYTNLASMAAADVSTLYTRNMLDFFKLIIDKDGGLNINHEDDIVVVCLLSQTGQAMCAPAATSAAK